MFTKYSKIYLITKLYIPHTASVTKDCDFKVTSAGNMAFIFENVKNKVFLKATDSAVTVVSCQLISVRDRSHISTLQ